MFIVGLLVAVIATVCIAAGRLLNRIREDVSGKIFLALGGFFLALDISLLHGLIWLVAPISVTAGLLGGGALIRKRGLR